MTIENNIRKWQQKILNNSCLYCKKSCCDTSKYNIPLQDFSLPLFQEAGIKIIKKNKLQKDFMNILNRVNEKVHFKDGSLVEMPSIIEVPKKYFGVEWLLYSKFCPFYDTSKKRCKVHNDPRRPDTCKNYPLSFYGCSDPNGKFLDVKILPCECFNNKEIQKELIEKFPVRIIN